MWWRFKKACFYVGVVLVVIVGATLACAIYQGRQTPSGKPVYVALGSSYAAGAGLGALQSGSPLLCARSIAGYPQQLARALRLPIVDMSCGGAVTSHLLDGGQYFQGPQIRVITRETRLVTITIGGNDLNYVGDLSMLALRKSDGLGGWLAAHFWSGPKSPAQRNTAKLKRELTTLIAAIRQRAPDAQIVVATYPAAFPPSGTCPQLRLTAAEADLMRQAGRALAEATIEAARRGGAIVVDMNALGVGHDACSSDPWIHGWSALSAAPFHPTLAGARATANAIADALRRSPTGIPAVR